jgi:hypothetical protein
VLGLSNLPLSTILIFDFGIVPTVCVFHFIFITIQAFPQSPLITEFYGRHHNMVNATPSISLKGQDTEYRTCYRIKTYHLAMYMIW